MSRYKPTACDGCPCYAHGTDFSQVEGSGSSGVMQIGEASGEHEQRDQLPFRPYAPAGGVLERVWRRMGLRREMFSISNVLRCRPRNNWLDGSPWEYSALAHCRPNLQQAISERKPRAIMALGGIALRELTGMDGEKLGISYLAGYPLPLIGDLGDSSIPVIGNFHPAFIRRGKASYQGVFARIQQRALNLAQGKNGFIWGVEPDQPQTWGGRRYILHPSVDQARGLFLYLKDNPALPIAKDIETAESASMDEDAREGFRDTQVRQIQFSIGPGTGMAMPWRAPFIQVAEDLLNLPNPSYGHNWDNYDHKVLRAAAEREGWKYQPQARVFDTLDMFHSWQPDLPAHLQFCCLFINWEFPWKHMHTLQHEPFYGCCDVDATWQLGEFLVKALKADGIWNGELGKGYVGQVYQVRPVLAKMEDRGLPVDEATRLGLGAEFDAAREELGLALQSRVPRSCLKIEPKIGYVKLNPELRKLMKCGGDGTIAPVEILNLRLKTPDKIDNGRVKEGKYYCYSNQSFEVARVGESGEPEVGLELRWCRVYEFNPNSADQLKLYMKAKGHKVPKSKRNEDENGDPKDTTEKKELIRLAHRHEDDFYLRVIEYREYTKMKGTYIDGFKPQDDGRVHTTFTFDTGTGQLTSRNPNIQNYPAHHRLGDAVGRMIAAPSGMILTKWDYRAFHVLTTGLEAESANWMRMARLDMHSFVAGEFMKVWQAQQIFGETDEELLERFKWFKSDPSRKRVRDKQAKPADLGIGFGMGARRLFQENMEHFSGEKEAKKFHDVLRGVFGEVFSWQDRIKLIAHEMMRLVSKFGHHRRFYEVLRPDPKNGGRLMPGDQAEEAVAFLPANHAHGHMRDRKKALADSGLDERYGLCNSVHDAFWFCLEGGLLEQHLAEVAPVLRAPSSVLIHSTLAPHGLWCDVEVKTGPNLTDMHELELPKAGFGVLPIGWEIKTPPPQVGLALGCMVV